MLCILLLVTGDAFTGVGTGDSVVVDRVSRDSGSGARERGRQLCAGEFGAVEMTATQAKAYLDAVLAAQGGSQMNLATLFPRMPASGTEEYVEAVKGNYQPANLGQLKAVAKPFYDRLNAVGFDTRAYLVGQGYPADWVSPYPWPLPTGSAEEIAENYAPANLGQLKLVFGFAVEDFLAPLELKFDIRSNSRVFLYWNGASWGGGSYELQVKSPGIDFYTLATFTSSENYFEHDGLHPGVEYTYRVRALDETGGVIACSEEVEISSFREGGLLNESALIPDLGLRLWLRADAGVMLNEEGRVAGWEDQSDCKNHASSSGAGGAALKDAMNRPKEIDFSVASSSSLTLPQDILSGMSGAETFVILRSKENQYSGYPLKIEGGELEYPGLPADGEGTVIRDRLARENSAEMQVPDFSLFEEYYLYNASASGGKWNAWLNNQLLISLNSEKLSLNGDSEVGGGNWQGSIAEIIVYNRSLTDTERRKVAGYLNEKYQLGIEGLPTVHFFWGDEADYDGDGVSNYWERFLGSNPFITDDQSDPNSCGFTIAQRNEMLQRGERDPFTGMSLADRSPTVSKLKDSNLNGFSDHQELQLGYDPSSKSSLPPVPRYVIVDLGAVKDELGDGDERLVAISEKNGWVVSNTGRRWHLQKTLSSEKLEGPLWEDISANYLGDEMSNPRRLLISDIGNDGSVLANGYDEFEVGGVYSGGSGNRARSQDNDFGHQGHYWDSNGHRINIESISHLTNDPNHNPTSYYPIIPSGKCQAWGIKFLENEKILYGVAELGHYYTYNGEREDENKRGQMTAIYPVIGGRLGGVVEGASFLNNYTDSGAGGAFRCPYQQGDFMWSTSPNVLMWVNGKGSALYGFDFDIYDGGYGYEEGIFYASNRRGIGGPTHSVISHQKGIFMPRPEEFFNALGHLEDVEIYRNAQLNCLSRSGMAVGSKYENGQVGEAIFTDPSRKEVRVLSSKGGEDVGPALFVNSGLNDNDIIAAKKHVWFRKAGDESQFPSNQFEFDEAVRLSALVDFDCGWTDGWEIQGVNDDGLLIGAGWKIKDMNANRTTGGELIIDHNAYSPDMLEKHFFVMIPFCMLTDTDRDGIIAKKGFISNDEGGEGYPAVEVMQDAPSSFSMPWRFWMSGGKYTIEDEKEVLGYEAKGSNWSSSRVVAGVPDLQNFFPILIDCGEAGKIFPVDGLRYKLKSRTRLDVIEDFDVESEQALSYMKGVRRENDFIYMQKVVDEYAVCKGERDVEEVELPDKAKQRIAAGKELVLLVRPLEGHNVDSISFVIENNFGEVLLEKRFYVSFGTVDEMFRRIQLRGLLSVDVENGLHAVSAEQAMEFGVAAGERALRLGCYNRPDEICKNEWVIFSHGYGTAEHSARLTDRQIFKRLFWSGMNGKFITLSWFGNPGGWSIASSPYNYHQSVINAFQTAPALAGAMESFPEEKTFIAHSLGTGLVSAAAQFHGLRGKRFFMLDSAIMQEAFDAAANRAIEMVSKENTSPEYNGKKWTWRKLVDEGNERLLASEWHLLFPEGDPRRKLTWRGLYSDVSDAFGGNIVNLYSSTEEVLAKYDGDDLLNWDWRRDLFSINWMSLDEVSAFSWAKQEKFKGDKRSFLGAVETGSLVCGYGFNEDDYSSGLVISKDSPSDDNLKKTPFFRPEPKELFDGNAGKVFAREHRFELLAQGIPSRSLPAGANKFGRLVEGEGISSVDMHQNFKTNEMAWPRYGHKNGKTEFENSWYHSDFCDVPYSHNYKLYHYIVEKGELK